MEETTKNEESSKKEAPKTGESAEKKEQPNIMALISYIGPLCLIPILTKEKDEFVNFHAKQGMVLLVGEVAGWIIFSVIPFLWFLGNLLGILWLVLSVVGIVNVVKNEKRQIPLIGKFAGKIKI